MSHAEIGTTADATVTTDRRAPIDLCRSPWSLTCLEGALASRLPTLIPARVPGCVHTDLMAADLLADPYHDSAEDDQHWIGRARWLYSTAVELPAVTGESVCLVCNGLDTVATVRLNGIEVGATANMHRRYRIDVTGAAREGTNELEIEFSSAWDYAEALEHERGRLPGAYSAPFSYIRKMACNFGWDWGPTLVTAGIWRPITIEIGDTNRLGDLRPQATWSGTPADGIAHLRLDPEGAEGRELRAVVTGPGVDGLELTGTGRIEADVPGARPWWPHCLGDQPLYRVEVTLHCGDRVVDRAEIRTGFRTVALDSEPDQIGRRFALAINGIELFARGVNWIPDDCFPARVDSGRYAQRVAQAKAAGVDLIRVWGGGIYEDDAFYAACDEAGILVWQDFPFACAAYPEEEPIRSEVLAEARDNVSRLMPHPSLALWNGNNENLWGYVDWGWVDQLGGRSWGSGYYRDLLPGIVAELDPSRPYWPGSPSSGDPEVHPNAMTHGCSHIWDVWNVADYTVYAEHNPRFAAEFGFQGPPTWATLTQAVHDEPLAPDSPGMVAHEKADDGLGKLERGLAGHLPVPTDVADWHFATQLNQARAVAYGVRHHRALRGHCMGSIVWQLNDCWPVSSWSALDSGRTTAGDSVARRKPLWYALREAFADHLIISDMRRTVLVNDAGERWAGTLFGRSFLVNSTHTETSMTTFDVPPRSRIELELAVPDRSGAGLELVASSGERCVAFSAEDVDLGLPPGRWTGLVAERDVGGAGQAADRKSVV